MSYKFNQIEGDRGEELAKTRDRIVSKYPDLDVEPEEMIGTKFDSREKTVMVTDMPTDQDRLSAMPLKMPDMNKAVKNILADASFSKDLIIEALTSLCVGNLMLSGPPGTGKTLLSRLLSREFNIKLVEVTANSEWSVFDVIGALSLSHTGAPEPKHGHVTRAILECYNLIREAEFNGEGYQAAWIMIDEMNRCEIDRAFGSLFTALSGATVGSYRLDYINEQPVLRIPKRFRILAPLNTFDTRFVSGMSSALKRRFSRIAVLPAPVSSGMIAEGEFDLALEKAFEESPDGFSDNLKDVARADLEKEADTIRSIFGFLRGDAEQPRLPIGTAQIVDTLIYCLSLSLVRKQLSAEVDFVGLFDEALAARLTSALESDRTREIVSGEFLNELEKQYPELRRLKKRLEAFHLGQE